MKYVPWVLAALCILLVVGFWTDSLKTPSRIGLIDMGRILNESSHAIRLNEQLREKYEQLVAQLQNESDMDEENRAEYERAIYAEYLRFRQELEDQFQAALDQAISEIASAKNLQLVLDVDLVRYGGKDVSSEVIEQLK
ncbi:MAG: OmpH family outer membrane protein [Firmicutes bacterium]|nr:OmpH family outer membrane protein [Bacillota bacterium]